MGSNPKQKLVMCIDIDAFFVQAEQLRDPTIQNKAVAIQQHQDIIAANYQAKTAGVKKHMTPAQAREVLRKVNGAVVHVYTAPGGRVSYQPYQRLSKQFFNLLRNTTFVQIVEKGSIDEAYILVDVVGDRDEDNNILETGTSSNIQQTAYEMATSLRNKIQQELNLSVSIGVAANRLLAKLASRRAKPPNQGVSVVLQICDIQSVLSTTEAASLPGYGGKTAAVFSKHGVRFVSDVVKVFSSAAELERGLMLTPQAAAQLWDWSRGIDTTAVQDKGPPKSLSVQMTLTPVSLPMHSSVGGVSADGLHNGKLEPLLISAKDFGRRVETLMMAMGADLEERVTEDSEEYGGRRPSKLTVEMRCLLGSSSDRSVKDKVVSRSCRYPSVDVQKSIVSLVKEGASAYPPGAKVVTLRVVASGFISSGVQSIKKFLMGGGSKEGGGGVGGKEVRSPQPVEKKQRTIQSFFNK